MWRCKWITFLSSNSVWLIIFNDFRFFHHSKTCRMLAIWQTLFWWAFHNSFSFLYTEVFAKTLNCKLWNSNYKHKPKIGNTVAHGKIYAQPLCVYVHLSWGLWCAHPLTAPLRNGGWQIQWHAQSKWAVQAQHHFLPGACTEITCFLLWFQVFQHMIPILEMAMIITGKNCFNVNTR